MINNYKNVIALMKEKNFVLAEPVNVNVIRFTKNEYVCNFTVSYDELTSNLIEPRIECSANNSEHHNKSEPVNYSYQGLDYFIQYKLEPMLQKQRDYLNKQNLSGEEIGTVSKLKFR